MFGLQKIDFFNMFRKYNILRVYWKNLDLNMKYLRSYSTKSRVRRDPLIKFN